MKKKWKKFPWNNDEREMMVMKIKTFFRKSTESTDWKTGGETPTGDKRWFLRANLRLSAEMSRYSELFYITELSDVFFIDQELEN